MQALKGKIDKLCMKQGVPYMDILCYRENDLIFSYSFGEKGDGEEYLQMYSCSKPITALAAMILIEKGKMFLDDMVEKYLPEVSNAFLLNSFGEKVAPKNKMTIRHLLTMTAGFSYNMQTDPIQALIRKNKHAKLRDFIAAFVESPLSFEPGEQFQYSLCYDVLAAVIEVASGKSFSAFVQETIFKPLDMQKSFFDNQRCPLLEMYIADANGYVQLTDNKNYLLCTEEYQSGGAGLVCTLKDYSIFAQMLANGGISLNGIRIVGEEVLRDMVSEQIEEMSIKNQFTCIQGEEYGYGFGVRVRRTETEWGLPKGEFGWDGAAGSYLMVDPVHKISIVIGMNVRAWPFIFENKHLEIVKYIYENFLIK